jgi:hypothetical protein
MEPTKIYRFWAVVLLVCLCACSTKAKLSPVSTQGMTGNEAITVARNEAKKRQLGLDRAEWEAKLVGSDWVVTAWRLPKTPGGFVTITVSGNGRVAVAEHGE